MIFTTFCTTFICIIREQDPIVSVSDSLSQPYQLPGADLFINSCNDKASFIQCFRSFSRCPLHTAGNGFPTEVKKLLSGRKFRIENPLQMHSSANGYSHGIPKWFMLNHTRIKFKTGLFQPLSGSGMAGIQNWHIILQPSY